MRFCPGWGHQWGGEEKGLIKRAVGDIGRSGMNFISPSSKVSRERETNEVKISFLLLCTSEVLQQQHPVQGNPHQFCFMEF